MVSVDRLLEPILIPLLLIIYIIVFLVHLDEKLASLDLKSSRARVFTTRVLGRALARGFEKFRVHTRLGLLSFEQASSDSGSKGFLPHYRNFLGLAAREYSVIKNFLCMLLHSLRSYHFLSGKHLHGQYFLTRHLDFAISQPTAPNLNL